MKYTDIFFRLINVWVFISQVLRDCPRLKELHMEKTCIHVPDNYEVIETGAVNRNLKIFRFLGDMTSLLMNSFMTRGVAYYMPSLVELELQPESPVKARLLCFDT